MSLYDMANIPLRNKKFKPTNDSINERWDKLYENIKVNINLAPIVCLVGDRGQGKTQLGCSLIGYCCTVLNKSAYYTKAFDIFLETRAGMKGQDGKTELSAIEFFINPFLLVIDAFEVRGDTEYENRVLDHIIDKRYDKIKATIIIANDKKDAVKVALGKSIMSRVDQNGGIVEICCPNFRKEGKNNG